MSTRRVQSSAIKPRTLGAATAVTPWVRNPSWLALTAVGDSEQRFRGLVAVFPQSSYLALNATTSTGTYTVDWGDGSTSVNVASGTQADYLFDFNDADLAGTNAPVKLTDSGDLVERVDKDNNDIAHGYSNGMEVRFYNIVSTTGLTEAQTYYVINATTNNFQVTTKVGDATQIVALTTDGFATLLPYKQAIVNVTPTTANLSTFNLNVKNNTTGLQAYETGWLDIEVGSPNFTSITLGGSNVRFAMCERAAVRSFGSDTDQSSLFESFRKLQQVVLGNTASVTNMFRLFSNCSSLTTVPLFNTAAATNMREMFSGCSSLTSVPLLNTISAQNMELMFAGCKLLTTVPLFNTVAATNMRDMFTSCSSLTSVPLFNTAACTNMFGTFGGCTALTNVPLFDTTSVQNMQSMFNNCFSLITIPPFNTPALTNSIGMFLNCTSLTHVPLFNTAAVTSMFLMFAGCVSLTNLPLFNTALVTNMEAMLAGCTSLTTIPLFNTAAVTNANSLVDGCQSLSSVPALNVSAVSSSGNFNNIFRNCSSLSRIQAANFNYTFSVANCKLGATELNEIYTNLPTVATTQTITVTGNHGTAGDTPSIAENKGWTVAG